MVTTDRKKGLRLLCLVFFVTHVAMFRVASAHEDSNAFVDVHIDDSRERIEATVELSLLDLDLAIGLDANDDARLSWGEVRQAHDRIGAYIAAGLSFSNGDRSCIPEAGALDLNRRGARVYARIRLAAPCSALHVPTLHYAVLFDEDPMHRAFVKTSWTDSGRAFTSLVSPASPYVRLDTGLVSSGHDTGPQTGSGRWSQFLAFFNHGIEHIVFGFDHLLFLLMLLIGVWGRSLRLGQPTGLRCVKDIVGLVTMFSVAHSVSLALAVLGVVRFPSAYVEIAIALSVVLAAVNNVRPFVGRGLFVFAFAFGLLHGLGFSNALSDMIQANESLFIPLGGFNLGVEFGQLGIICVIMALAALVSRSLQHASRHPRQFATLSSWMAVAVGLYWLVTRVHHANFFL